MAPTTQTTARSADALQLMLAFAERTGLTTAVADRYLWTDAFAVCNFLGLGETALALRLVDQVHHTLGRHRDDDARTGWIGGLDDDEAEAHPTHGGLRIGKRLRERTAEEPLDERLEWERDGQYFHYLTKWMHALDQVSRSTGDPRFNRWALELADVSHRAFSYDAGAFGRRMYWKMSIDLSRPLLTSMGHHDPLDGFVTCAQLDPDGSSLADARADFAGMIPRDLETSDPLGIGGVLIDAWKLERLVRQGALDDLELRDRLLDAAFVGLSEYQRSGELDVPVRWRLAFRELGLAIGLAAMALLLEASPGDPAVERFRRFTPLRDIIESFWLRREHRQSATWVEHENINTVMLATSLSPEGFLARGE